MKDILRRKEEQTKKKKLKHSCTWKHGTSFLMNIYVHMASIWQNVWGLKFTFVFQSFISNTDLVCTHRTAKTGWTWNISFFVFTNKSYSSKLWLKLIYKHLCCYLFSIERILVKRVVFEPLAQVFGSFFVVSLQTKWILKLPKVPRHTLRQTSVSEHYPSVMHLVLLKPILLLLLNNDHHSNL